MFRVFRNIFRINQFYDDAQAKFAISHYKQALNLYKQSLQSNPNYPPALVGLSKCQLLLGQTNLASQTLTHLYPLKLGSQLSREFNNVRAMIYIQKKTYEQAEQYFQKSIGHQKTNTLGCISKIFLLIRMDRIQEYRDLLNKAISTDQAMPYHYFQKGLLELQQHKLHDAIKSFDKYISDGGRDQHSYYYRGSCYATLGDIKEAKQNFHKSLEHNNSRAETKLSLAEILVKSKEFQQALILTSQFPANNEFYPQILHLKGLCFYHLSKYEQAEQEFDLSLKLTEQNPNPSTLMYRGICRLEMKNREKQAIQDLLRSKNAKEPTDPELFYIYIYLGQAYSKLKKDSQALEFFNKAESIKPNDPQVLNLKGVTYIALNNLDNAEKYLNLAMKRAPNLLFKQNLAILYLIKNQFEKVEEILIQNPEIYKNNPTIAIQLCRGLRLISPNKALDVIWSVLKQLPQNQFALFAKAEILTEIGKYNQADAILEGLTKAYPESIEYPLARVQILKTLNKIDQAREVLRIAIDIHKHHEKATPNQNSESK